MPSAESMKIKAGDDFFRALLDHTVQSMNQALATLAENGYSVEINVNEDFGTIGIPKRLRITRRISKEL